MQLLKSLGKFEFIKKMLDIPKFWDVTTITGRRHHRARIQLARRGGELARSRQIDSGEASNYLISWPRIHRIDRILIPVRYIFFLKTHLQRTPNLSVLGLEQFRDE
jgi:hypothetical protein